MVKSLWSAGENSCRAREQIRVGLTILALWLILGTITIITVSQVAEIDTLGRLGISILYTLITADIIAMAYSRIKEAYKRGNRNRRFTIKILNHREYESQNIDDMLIVYSGINSVAICEDKQAVDDYIYFYRVKSLEDFK